MCQISVVFSLSSQHVHYCMGRLYIESQYIKLLDCFRYVVIFPFCFVASQPELKASKLWMKDTKVGVDHRFYPISFVQFKYSKLNCSLGQQRATAPTTTLNDDDERSKKTLPVI